MLRLLFIRLKVFLYNTIEAVQVVYRYYFRSPLFFKVDMALWALYASRSPFTISKEFLIKNHSLELYDYGETPLTTMEAIAKECVLSSSDIVAELGSGTGRTCFWLGQFIGCKTIGIEYIPEFANNAISLQKRFEIKNVRFLLDDMAKVILFSPTVVYLYGTTMAEGEIVSLGKTLTALPNGTKIITVSWSFADFLPKNNPFKIVKQFPASFPWGRADVYLQQIQSNHIPF